MTHLQDTPVPVPTLALLSHGDDQVARGQESTGTLQCPSLMVQVPTVLRTEVLALQAGD